MRGSDAAGPGASRPQPDPRPRRVRRGADRQGNRALALHAGLRNLEAHPALLERQPARFREHLLHYGYIDRRLKLFILCCDDARFLNHSETPNLGPDYTLERHGVDIALRGIREGEELTVDYRAIEEAP